MGLIQIQVKPIYSTLQMPQIASLKKNATNAHTQVPGLALLHHHQRTMWGSFLDATKGPVCFAQKVIVLILELVFLHYAPPLATAFTKTNQQEFGKVTSINVSACAIAL